MKIVTIYMLYVLIITVVFTEKDVVHYSTDALKLTGSSWNNGTLNVTCTVYFRGNISPILQWNVNGEKIKDGFTNYNVVNESVENLKSVYRLLQIKTLAQNGYNNEYHCHMLSLPYNCDTENQQTVIPAGK